MSNTKLSREGTKVGKRSENTSENTSALSVRNQSFGTPLHRIPDDIRFNVELNKDIALLPQNYNFELHKTIWRLRRQQAKRVALQLPEGLAMYATTICNILRKYAGVQVAILGDVTYGACCVDDYTASMLGCDFLIHYGHSCLVPVQECQIPVMYVFVSIYFQIGHFVDCLKKQFEPNTNIYLVSTVQFVSCLPQVVEKLKEEGFMHVTIPQCKPLSPGELLGCTCPILSNVSDDKTYLVYVADGRFHLESIMIANPSLPAYRYDPYSKLFTRERYDHVKMQQLRFEAVTKASYAQRFGIVLGTLGRQGKKYIVVLISELSPQRLSLFEDSIDVWIQIACPRLSIDWGHEYPKVLLTPYEALVAIGKQKWQSIYPMDYYAKDGKEWSNYYRETT
eukprot:jgi/Galph1/2805/GphlegSOOS_G1441.1